MAEDVQAKSMKDGSIRLEANLIDFSESFPISFSIRRMYRARVSQLKSTIIRRGKTNKIKITYCDILN